MSYTQEFYPYPKWSQHNDRGDAFRHCVLSAFMTKRANAGFAQRMGDAHEYGAKDQDERELHMDLHNNGYGRHVGLITEDDKDRTTANVCSADAASKLWWFGHGV